MEVEQGGQQVALEEAGTGAGAGDHDPAAGNNEIFKNKA